MSKPNTKMTESLNRVTLKEIGAVPAELTIGQKIFWKATGARGRGVFAAVDFQKGDVLEQSPVTVVPKAEADFIDQSHTGLTSVIDCYLLRWQTDVKGQEYCLGHGYLMLYNHNAQPNADLEYDFERKTISMVALWDIKAGEELTFDYDCDIWFDIKE